MTELERKFYLLALEVMEKPQFDDAHQIDIYHLAQRDGIIELGVRILDAVDEFRPVLDSLEKKGYLVRAVDPYMKHGVMRNSWIPVDLLTAMSKEID